MMISESIRFNKQKKKTKTKTQNKKPKQYGKFHSHTRKYFYPEGVPTQAAQRGHGVSMLGDEWCLTGHDPELCAVKDVALIKGAWPKPPP